MMTGLQTMAQPLAQNVSYLPGFNSITHIFATHYTCISTHVQYVLDIHLYYTCNVQHM